MSTALRCVILVCLNRSLIQRKLALTFHKYIQSIADYNPEIAHHLLTALGLETSLVKEEMMDIFMRAKTSGTPSEDYLCEAAIRAQRWLKERCPVKTEGANDVPLCFPPGGGDMAHVSKKQLGGLGFKLAQVICSTRGTSDQPSVEVEGARLQAVVDSTLTFLWELATPHLVACNNDCINQIKAVRVVCGDNDTLFAHCASQIHTQPPLTPVHRNRVKQTHYNWFYCVAV